MGVVTGVLAFYAWAFLWNEVNRWTVVGAIAFGVAAVLATRIADSVVKLEIGPVGVA
jgi:hypothetical protein